MKKTVSIIICCYNEEENIPVVIRSIHENMANTNYEYEIIVVNDGSHDRSMDVLLELCESDKRLFYINLSRNFGHQNALKAGLDYASGDCVISLDADMQHPPQLLPVLLSKWEEGYDVVYTRRKQDPSLPARKRITSALFYKFLNAMSELELEDGTADFRLLDSKVVDVIGGLREKDPFMRGLVKWVGFKQYAVDYAPHKRLSGESKYTLRKMVSLALEGITSFSVKPLYLALYLGFFMAVVSLLFIPYAVISYFMGVSISGWASLIVAIGFLNGLQLFIIGLVALYIGKIFMQTKGRPTYIIRNTNLKRR